MCLDTVTKIGLDKSGYGWKVFNKHSNGTLRGENRNTKTIIPRNRWQKAVKCKITYWLLLPNKFYSSGFHVFLTRAEAREWDIYKCGYIAKVKYRKGHTAGGQRSLRVIVADEMLILPLQKKGKAKCKKK